MIQYTRSRFGWQRLHLFVSCIVKKIYLFLFLMSPGQSLQAQSAIPGEYYLRGVTEVASGFLFKPDSTFEFFFSYGALDRMGSGKWAAKGNEIILNSKPRPIHDFALISSKSSADDFITIKITDKNELLQRYVYAKIKYMDTVLAGMTNEKGEVQFPRKPMQDISLQFEFCPEKTSVFVPADNHNYFEFRFEPWIVEYFFTNFHLTVDGKDLRGKHPLLDDKEYLFERRK